MPATRSKAVAVPTFVALLAGGAFLAGCSGFGSGSSASSASTTIPYQADHSATGASARADLGHTVGRPLTSADKVGESITPAAPLVIRNGTVVLSVAKSHVVRIFDEVSSVAAAMGGFVASSSSRAFGDTGGASLVVRVPSTEFGALVARVDSLGKVRSQSESGDDVTGESIDIEASLANLRSEEGALRALIARAGSIASILQVQDQLFGVEGDIEQLTAQESSLIDRATFSTLSVALMPIGAPVKPKPKAQEENSFVHAIRLAAHNTAVAVRALVVALGWAFPLLVLALVAFGGWRLGRRIFRKRAAEPSLPPTA